MVSRLAAVLAGFAIFLAAAPAEARFGKRSSEEKKAQHKEEKKKSKEKKGSSNTHRAAPVGTSSGSNTGSGGGRVHVGGNACCVDSGAYVGVGVHTHTHVDHYGHYGPAYVAPAPYVHQEHHEEERGVQRVETFLTAQPLLNGLVLGAQVRADWKHFGFDVRYDHLALLAEDGTLSFDSIRLLDTTLSLSLLNGDRGRLRAHLGLYSAFAPDIIFVGPGGGLSASMDLFGPFTAEAAGHVVLIPYTKVDTWAGVGLRIGVFEGRGGLRFTMLDDQGRVDGVVNRDVMVGPYVSAGVVF